MIKLKKYSYRNEDAKSLEEIASDIEQTVLGTQGRLKEDLHEYAKEEGFDFKDVKAAAIALLKLKDIHDDWGNYGDEDLDDGITEKDKRLLLQEISKL